MHSFRAERFRTMNKNRKVIRLAPVRAVPPRNECIEEKRAEAFNRLTLWLTVAMFGGSFATAVVYVGVYLTDTIPFATVVSACVVGFTVSAIATHRVVTIWEGISEATERLDKRERVLITVRSRQLH